MELQIYSNDDAKLFSGSAKNSEKKSKIRVKKFRPKKEHKCESCGKTFERNYNLKMHIQSVHNQSRIRYKCDLCGEDFCRKEILRVHVVSFHFGIQYKCDLCGKAFHERRKLEIHKDAIHAKELYKCELCEKHFERNYNLNAHIQCVHNNAKIRYKCDLCGEDFCRKEILKAHIDSIQPGVQFDCDSCEKIFHEERKLKKHNESTHSKSAYECKLCGKYFERKYNLKTHIRSVHNNSRTRYECNLCGKDFCRKEILGIHINSIHLGVQFKCDLCGKVFHEKRKLEAHKDAIHTKKLYKCELCDRVFRRRHKLEIHKHAIHRTERRYERDLYDFFLEKGKNTSEISQYDCEVCGANFNEKDKLDIHNDLIHLGIQYECDLCGEIFNTREKLKIHKDLVHLGIQYGCNLCGEVFTKQDELTIHNDLIHSETNCALSQTPAFNTASQKANPTIINNLPEDSKSTFENNSTERDVVNESSCSFNRDSGIKCEENLINIASNRAGEGSAEFLSENYAYESRIEFASPSTLYFNNNCDIKSETGPSLILPDVHFHDSNQNFQNETETNAFVISNTSDSRSTTSFSTSIVISSIDVENIKEIPTLANSSQTDVASSDENRQYQSVNCQECAQVFCVEEDLAEHMEIHHGETKELACIYCQEVFSGMVLFQSHLRSHFE